MPEIQEITKMYPDHGYSSGRGLGKQDLEGVPTVFRAADWEELKALI